MSTNSEQRLQQQVDELTIKLAIADLQREKDAKICESVSFERRNQGNHIGFNAMHECAESIRANKESPESDIEQARRLT